MAVAVTVGGVTTMPVKVPHPTPYLKLVPTVHKVLCRSAFVLSVVTLLEAVV
jgi:hypothetical protein